MSLLSKILVHNFYETKAWLDFCALQSGKKRNGILIKSTAIPVSHYPKPPAKKYLSIIETPTHFLEYPVLFANATYSQNFKKMLRRSSRRPFVLKKSDGSHLNAVYTQYKKQIFRQGGIVFPKSYFRNFLKLPGASLFVVLENNNLAAYSFAIEYKDNMYLSVGGTAQSYLSTYVNYFKYDALAAYARSKGHVLHLGLSVSSASYAQFKHSMGAVCFGVHCPHEKAVKLAYGLSRNWFTRRVAYNVSKLFPKKAVYYSLPFT